MPTTALSTGSLYTYGLARAFELAAEAGLDARHSVQFCRSNMVE